MSCVFLASLTLRCIVLFAYFVFVFVFVARTMPEMLTELDKPTDLRVYTIAQARLERKR